MISSSVTRANALFQALSGLALLFAADNVLPEIVPSYPTGGIWLGQLLGAALLALANLNYFNRSAMIGGIYGRALTSANATFYFVSALTLLRHASRTDVPVFVWVITGVCVLFAAIYGWLLFRGPFERDMRDSAQLPSSETNTTIRP